MINKLYIQNFQSHKDTKLEFSSGINVITGESDNGKTAILRSLNWLVNNKPAGDNYRSTWGGDTSIKLWLDNSQWVSKIKTDKKHVYSICDGVDFEAFGQGVPEDIQKVLNFSELNFQFQHDNHFLISESPAEIARYFNKLVNLEVIDNSLKNAIATIKKLKSNIEFHNGELKATEQAAEELSWIEQAKQDFKRIELIDNKIQARTKELEELEYLFDSYNKLQAEKITFDIEKAGKDLTEIEELQNKITEKENDIEELQNLFDSWIDIQHLKVDWDIQKASKDIESIKLLNKEIEDIEQEMLELQETQGDIQKVKIIIRKEREHISFQRQKLKEIMPEVCPLCSQVIKKGALI